MPVDTKRVQSVFAAVVDAAPADRPAILDRECGGDAELRWRVESLLKAHDDSAELPAANGGTGDYASAAIEKLAPGSVFAGRYKLREQLGEGGMGVVYVADQLEPVQRRVALKIIRANLPTETLLARFEQERQALALMDHPNIAKVYDAGVVGSEHWAVGRSVDSEQWAVSSEEKRSNSALPTAHRPLHTLPYFVMELIKGLPITKYCDDAKLTPRQRLELFIPVCQAVQHAHQKGIIHRDLKPANIIVGLYDGRPVPKVIDFGVAKMTGPRLTEHSVYTEVGSIIGTLEYMSPEQAELNNLDIDTRTDIYALGVILYELLTGMVPFSRKEMQSAGFGEMLRIIKEQEPSKPSTKLSGSGSLPSVAACRLTEPAKLTRLIRGELDWITMKALEKDRSRRYETANGFAADINRYLSGEPVLAHPPSSTYRFKKLLRKNKGPVIAITAVAVALLVGMVGFAWQTRIAQKERDLAENERNRAVSAEAEIKKRANELKLVSDFQEQMLGQVDPTRAGKLLSDDVKAKLEAALIKAKVPDNERDEQMASFAKHWQRINATDAACELIDLTILRPAVAAIDKQFAGQPLVDAALRQVLANRYRDIGLYNAALPLQERALATRRHVLGEECRDTIESINYMGYLQETRGMLKEAEPYYREALEKSRRVLGESHPETLVSINSMGSLLLAQGNLRGAEPYFQEALAKRRRVLGEEHPETISTIGRMGHLLLFRHELNAAEPYLREALAKFRRVSGEEHPDTLAAINNMGTLLSNQGRLKEAEVYLREAVEKNRRVHGEEHPHTITSINNLGQVLQAQGRLSEAEQHWKEALEKNRRVRGDMHPETLTSIGNMGFILKLQAKLSDAERYLRECLEKSRVVLGEEHQNTLIAIMNLSSVTEAQGRYDEAVQVLAPVETAIRTAFGAGNPRGVAQMLLTLGKAHSGLSEFTTAEKNLLEAHPIFVTTRGPTHQVTRECSQAIVDLYTAWHTAEPGKGYDVKAAEWKAKLEATKTAPQ